MAIATGIVGAATGAAKFFEGASQESRAQDAINKFRFSELQNPYRSTRVSTLGADLQAMQASQQGASALDALQASGTRGVLGGLPQLTAQQQNLNQRIGADLDQQQTRLDYAAAQQDVRNQELMRQAESQELAGYGQQLNVGMGMKYGGLTNIANTAGLVGQTKIGERADNWITNLLEIMKGIIKIY